MPLLLVASLLLVAIPFAPSSDGLHTRCEVKAASRRPGPVAALRLDHAFSRRLEKDQRFFKKR